MWASSGKSERRRGQHPFPPAGIKPYFVLDDTELSARGFDLLGAEAELFGLFNDVIIRNWIARRQQFAQKFSGFALNIILLGSCVGGSECRISGDVHRLFVPHHLRRGDDGASLLILSDRHATNESIG